MFPSRLTEGYQAFHEKRFSNEQGRYRRLAERGQHPEIMVVGCVDSRVSPEVIFDAALGELLVVRNVANIVPAYEEHGGTQHGTSAALEFGVQALRVAHIVVLGHAHCGGIRAFADKQAPLSSGDFIGRWMSQIAPAAESLVESELCSHDEYLRRLEYASVELSLKHLMTFPWIKSGVTQGTLELHGAIFRIAAGRLLVRNPATDVFEVMERGFQGCLFRGDQTLSAPLPKGSCLSRGHRIRLS